MLQHWCEDSSSSIDKPIVDLEECQISLCCNRSLLIFGWIGMLTTRNENWQNSMIENSTLISSAAIEEEQKKLNFFLHLRLNAGRATLASHSSHVLAKFPASDAWSATSNLIRYRQHSIPIPNQFHLQSHHMTVIIELNIARD